MTEAKFVADLLISTRVGSTPLTVAANMGHAKVIQYLFDVGADLGAFDLGRNNDGAFGARVEPLMPIDYTIGVGTFVPTNAFWKSKTRSKRQIACGGPLTARSDTLRMFDPVSGASSHNSDDPGGLTCADRPRHHGCRHPRR